MTLLLVEEEITILQRILWVLNTLFHNILAIVTFFMLWILFENNNSSNKLLWHAFWSTIAYLPLMAEGFVLFSESNTWTPKLKRRTKQYIHGTVLLASVVCVSIGMILEIERKNEGNAEHFVSEHAKLGLASWIFCFITSVLGVMSLYSQSLKRFIPPVYLKLFHNLTGLAAYTTGIASLIVGLDKRMFAAYVSQEHKDATVFWISAITVFSVLEALRSMYNQLKSLF